jgi:hypothetical protein
MRAIQSFIPLSPDHRHVKDYFLSTRNSLFCYILSSLLAKLNYEHLTLYTTKKGKQLLVETLKLPYDETVIFPAEVENMSAELWIYHTMYACSKESGAFVYLDENFFSWKALPEEFTQFPVFRLMPVRHFSFNDPQFSKAEEYILKPYLFRSKEITDRAGEKGELGFIGGAGNDFFKSFFTEIATYTRDLGISSSQPRFIQDYNYYIMEALFYKACTRSHTIPISYLSTQRHLEPHLDLNIRNTNISFHFLKGYYRVNGNYIQEVENIVRHTFPDFYFRGIKALRDTRALM